MRPIRPWLAGFVLVGLGGALLLAPNARGGDVGFVEDFALAKDRAAALKQLIPGTEDYYYYHCLHYLNTEQFDKIEALTRPWHERHGQTARLTEIQTRHALLDLREEPGEDARLRPKPARAALRSSEGNARRRRRTCRPRSIRTLIARATLKASSLARWGNLDNFEDVALDWLAAEKLELGTAAQPASAAAAARHRRPAASSSSTT